MSILASHIWTSRQDRETSLRIITLVYLGLLIVNGGTLLAFTVWLIITQITSCSYLSSFMIEVWVGFSSSLVFLGLGIATCVTTSCKRNQDKLRTFFSLTLIGTTLQVICTAFASVHHTQVYNGKLQAFLEIAVMKNYSSNKDAKICMDGIQTRFKCCGVAHTRDWLDLINLSPPYPDSCNCSRPRGKEKQPDFCREWTASGTNGSTVKKAIYQRPCLGQVQRKLGLQCNIFRYYCPLSITANFLQLLIAYCFAIKIQNHSVVDVYKVPSSTPTSRTVSSVELDDPSATDQGTVQRQSDERTV